MEELQVLVRSRSLADLVSSRGKQGDSPAGRRKLLGKGSSLSNAELSATRNLKDWAVAGDLAKRSLRGDTLRYRRQAFRTLALGGSFGGSPGYKCHLARGPMEPTLQLEVSSSSSSWHRKVVRNLFKSLNSQNLGKIKLEELKESFQALKVPMDEQTFENYVQRVWPEGSDKLAAGVTKSEFVKFHSAVWENQPAAVRRHAGDPDLKAKAAAAPALEEDTHPDQRRMLERPRSEPAMSTMSDLRDQERRLRKVFSKHAGARGSLLSRDSIPAVLQDIGLPDEVEAASMSLGENLSFSETVNVVNRCVASREGQRVPRSQYERSVGQRLESALQYAADVGDADSEDDLKGKACAALEALFGSDEDDLVEKARLALEEALLGGDDDEDDLKDKARLALEEAFFGEEEDLKDKARGALEEALFGEEDDLKDKARSALEEALFGEEEDLKDKASLALETALFGEVLEEEAPVEEELMDKARFALEAALEEEAPVEEELMDKARFALEAAFFGEEDELKDKAGLALEMALFGEPLEEEDPVEEELMDKARGALEEALFGVDEELKGKAGLALQFALDSVDDE